MTNEEGRRMMTRWKQLRQDININCLGSTLLFILASKAVSAADRKEVEKVEKVEKGVGGPK